MNKKFFTTLLGFIIICAGISAQKTAKASGHLAVGVEASTTGFGLELATPMGSHFALRGGVSLFPAYSYDDNFNVNLTESFKTQFNEFVASDPELASALEQQGIKSANDINTDIKATATLNFLNGKILIDIYPWAKYAFHITGGVYIGRSDIIKVKGKMDQAANILGQLPPKYSDIPLITNDEKDYELTGNDIRNMQGVLRVNSVKPYLGIGFGRAVPKSRVGMSFEIGAFYQGTPEFVGNSSNVQKLIDAELTGVTDVIKKIPVYPVISLKLNLRIF